MIYIRHADKQYKNMKSELFKHDPGITKIGVERSRQVAKYLIELYGEPSRIVSSPFRRARETATIMNTMLKNPLEIEMDNKLSEYLGNHATTKLDVTPHTAVFSPPHPETFEDMKKRVKKHIEKVKINKPVGIVWVITHGIIMKQIAEYSGLKNIKSLPCLTCLKVTETSEFYRSELLISKNNGKKEETVKRRVFY